MSRLVPVGPSRISESLGSACQESTDTIVRYKVKVPAALDRVRAMSSEQLIRVIDMFGMIQMPAVSFVSLAVKHSVHHRGQLNTYLRPMGGKVPGIYVSTADTQ